MSAALIHAHQRLSAAIAHLQAANLDATPVASLLLVPMIADVSAIAKRLSALQLALAELHVVIEVSGGVAECTVAPVGVSVEIIDHDNLEDPELTGFGDGARVTSSGSPS